MEAFKSYLIEEFKDKAKGYVAVEFKFNHSTNIKLDKPKPKGLSPDGRSSKLLSIDIIKVNVKFVDKEMHQLYSSIVTFENNSLTKANAKKLINISPKELENKFMLARNDICKSVLNDLVDKSNELNTKIDSLKSYIGVDGIIPDQFKGEVIHVVDDADVKDKNKQHFDM